MAAETDGALDSPQMIGPGHFRCRVMVVNEMGLHARPASMFVSLSSKYKCDVIIRKGSQEIDGKSIMLLLTLCAEVGTPLDIETRGQDAAEAIVALRDLVATGFGV